MKLHMVLLASTSATLAVAVSFGPRNCVDLSKSAEGTCVLRTDCNGVDTSNFEFAFDCLSSTGNLQRHSFGFGGFDNNEEYDTAVKCTECRTPEQEAAKTPAKTPAQSTTKAPEQEQQVMAVAQREEKKEEEKKEEKKEEAPITPPANAKIAKFGPDNCVSTWRDPKTAHCIVKTDCQGKDTTNYMFGLICGGTTCSKQNEKGLVCEGSAGPVRHLFGKDSFEAVETFDTLIPCTECLALDAIPEDVQLADQINALGEDIKGMSAGMTELEKDVEKLNAKVFKTEEKKEEKKEEEKAEEKKEEKAEEKKEEEKAEEKKEEKKEEEKTEEDKKVFFMREHDKESADDSDDADDSSDDAPLSDTDIDESVSFHRDNKLRGHVAHKRRHNVHHKRKHRHNTQEDEEDADRDDDEERRQKVHHMQKHRQRAQEEDEDGDQDDDEDADSDDRDHQSFMHSSAKAKKGTSRKEKSKESKTDADTTDDDESSDRDDDQDADSDDQEHQNFLHASNKKKKGIPEEEVQGGQDRC